MGLSDVLLGNYKTVADRLGLSVADFQITGVVDGVPLRMWFGSHSTHVAALLSRPANVEVGIATKGLVTSLKELFGSHSAGIGDANFDNVFSIRATDPSRVAALLDPDARRALLEVASESLHPAVDAHSIHLHRFSQGGVDNPATIERDFHEAARLSKVISASFARTYR